MQAPRPTRSPRPQNITIGALARRSGCTVPTIRYYEEIGLIAAPMRSGGGHRVYGADTEERLRFIRRCRDFGFSIERVRELLDLSESTSRDCNESLTVVRDHLRHIEGKMDELRALHEALRVMERNCSAQCAGGPAANCCIVDDIVKSAPIACGTATARLR